MALGLAEALAILGIDARTDARTARRAYLRRVKQHPPERDPAGFQRLREAWELASPRLPQREPEPEPEPLAAPEPEPEPEPLAAPEPEPEARPDLALARALVGDRPAQALAILHAAIAGQPTDPLPQLDPALRLVLELHRAGAHAEGTAAWEAMRTWIARAGVGTRVSADRVAAMVQARELSELPGRLPAGVRYRIAQAALDGDLRAAAEDLAEFTRDDAQGARVTLRLLEAHAPALLTLYGQALGLGSEPEVDPRSPRGGRSTHRWVYLAIVLVAVLLRACAEIPALALPATVEASP